MNVDRPTLIELKEDLPYTLFVLCLYLLPAVITHGGWRVFWLCLFIFVVGLYFIVMGMLIFESFEGETA